jgi:hypothetical protein
MKKSQITRLVKQKVELDRITREIAIKRAKKDIPRLPLDNIQAFNKCIGLPLHPFTLQPGEMFDYQIEYIQAIFKYHKVILNKSTKIGATEAALRGICQNCYGPYMGHNVIFVAGNRQEEANIILERFDELFVDGWTDLDGKKWSYGDLVMNKKNNRMQLYSNVDIRTIPADARALRAQANVKCIFFTEPAHINSLDDSKIFMAAKSRLMNDDTADLILESSPNGLRGFFSDEFHNEKSVFHKLTMDYKRSLGKLITQKQVDEAKRDPRPYYFRQEFEANFLGSGNAAIDPDKIRYTQKKLIDLDN